MAALVLLLSLCGAWLLICFFLPGRATGILLVLAFAALWALLVFTTSLSWRNYLMIWLCGPIAIALGQLIPRDRPPAEPRLAVAGVSAVGLLGLWLAGGAAGGPYVLAAVLSLAGAALFGGLGFYLCWQRLGQPAQRAQQSAENQRAAAEESAAAANRRITRIVVQLDQAQRSVQSLRAENERLRAIRPAVRPAPWPPPARRPAPPLTPPATRSGPADDDQAGPAGQQDAAALVRVTVYAVPVSRAAAGAQAQPGAYVRLLIRREEITARPDPRIAALRQEYERPTTSAGRRDAIRAAVADYAGQQIQGAARIAVWQTPAGVPVADVAGYLAGSADWLRSLVATPLSGLASTAGLPGPLAAAGAGITANFVTAPLTTPLEAAARVCEVAGMIFGAVTGLHPVTVVCAKMFAHDEVGRGISAAVEKAIDELTPESPAPGPAVGTPEIEPGGIGRSIDPPWRDIDGPAAGGFSPLG